MRYIITSPDPSLSLPIGLSSDSSFVSLDLIGGLSGEMEEAYADELSSKGYQVTREEEYFTPVPRSPVRTSSAIDIYPTRELDPRTPGSMKMMQKTGVERMLMSGLSGKGVHIGFVDSGVDVTHLDIMGRNLHFKDFTPDESPRSVDPAGHGTGCVGMACGNGFGVAKFHGVAPGANYSMARVMDGEGRGSETNIILGLQWLDEKGCDIINVSIGSLNRRYSPLSAACDEMARRGRIVCIAAGNDGPKTITSPANAYGGITVAACDEEGKHRSFSSIGPAMGIDRENLKKPDVMAWGENCPLCRASGTTMGTVIHESYVSAAGTSFAAPFVAGLAALYKEARGDLSGFITELEENCIDDGDIDHELEGYGVASIGFLRGADDPPFNPPVNPLGGCLLAGLTPLFRIFR